MNPSASPDVSFILVNYFSKHHTLHCLQSIEQKTRGVRYDVWVVDNSREMDAALLAARWPNARLLMPDRNLGFGAANHWAATQALTPYLFFLNNDAELVNDAATVLFRFLESHQEAGL